VHSGEPHSLPAGVSYKVMGVSGRESHRQQMTLKQKELHIIEIANDSDQKILVPVL
jgi:hypothetical protein